MGYCSKCGKVISASAALCEECRTKLAQTEEYMDNLLKNMNQGRTVRHLGLKPKKDVVLVISDNNEAAPADTDPELVEAGFSDVSNQYIDAVDELLSMNDEDISMDDLQVSQLNDIMSNDNDDFPSDAESGEALTVDGRDTGMVTGIDNEESVDDNSMADNLDNEPEKNINTESDPLIPHDEGDALEELFAVSEDNNDYDELSDIDMSEFNLEDLLQVSDNAPIPSLDELMMADGSDEIDALLQGGDEDHSDILETLDNISLSDLQQPEEDTQVTEEDIQQPEEDTQVTEEDIQQPEEDTQVTEEDIQQPEEDTQVSEEDISTDDYGTNSEEEPEFSLDDLMLDDSGNAGMIDEDIGNDEDIDLMGLLTGGSDSLELIDGHSPEEIERQKAQDGSEENYDDMQSVSSGSNQVMIDNDILSIDNLDDPGGSMGDVFSDALSALSSEQDKDEPADVSELLDNSKSVKKKKKQKKGRLNGLFGNIVDDKEITKVQEEKKAAEQAEKQQELDEEKQKELAAEKEKKKAEAKEAKARAKEEKSQKKLAKKQAKKDEKELRELEEEAEIEGRINKVGASIVFIVLILMAAFIFMGTKLFSYNNSISNAESYLEKGNYEQSYNELLGVDLKEEDKVLYQKVITIMYVYKQLEAYDVYYKESRYPEALDSLLKGIREYEKYMPDAIELDVSSDMDSVKNQIVNELVAEYGITEDMAKEINMITDSTEYSQRVYDLSQNLVSNHY